MPLRFAGQFATLALATSALSSYQAARINTAAEFHGVNPAYIDRRVSPTENFYRFTNGLWLDQVQIPHSEPAISATALARQRNEELMWQIISPTVVDFGAQQGSPEQLVGQFLRTGMNMELAENLRAKPIEPELQRISSIQNRGDLMAELARLHKWSIGAGFRSQVGFDYRNSSRKILNLYQSGLSLRARTCYLSDDAKSRVTKSKLARCIQKTLVLVGDSPESVVRSSERVLAIETRLAEAAIPESEVGDIEANLHAFKPADLAAQCPGACWPRYFQTLGVSETAELNVTRPEYFTAFDDLVMHVPIADWKIYLRWRLSAAASPYLSSEFVQEGLELDSILTGQEEARSRREVVLEAADACLGDELGVLLAHTNFAMNAKPKVLSMVQNIRTALRETISGLDWMAPGTKTKALEKLDKMQVDLCYPDRWRDSSRLVIAEDSFLQNVFRAREFDFQHRLDSISKPVDRTEWDVKAYAVDAHYNPSLNAIVLPAGVLQSPYFDSKADDASNYGSFGTVIGHEMMHAFDGRGRRFDADGNLNNWWSESDGVRYDEHQKAFVAQYSSYPVVDRLNVNGKLTLEENVADLGGVMVAYAACKHSGAMASSKKVDGFTPEQRFFVSFGQLFRCKARPECQRLNLESDPHSPPEFRVRGVLQNIPEFWKAFNAEPPKIQLRIW